MQALKDKIFLITGATDGIGKVAAINFAKHGANIVLIGRNKQKTEQVINEMKTVCSNNTLDYILCDLSRLSDVKHAGEKFKAKYDRLDVLVNNAGMVLKEPTLGADGIELTFTVNYLSHFLLTNLLFDLIKRTSGSRIITTSSAMHRLGKLDLHETPRLTTGSGMHAYATSKLCNVLLTKELQRRLNGTKAIANCFEPGFVRTHFGTYGGTDLGFFYNLIFRIGSVFAIPPEKGADSLIWLATSPEAGMLKGEYISKRKPITPSARAMDPELARNLWILSEKLCDEVLS